MSREKCCDDTASVVCGDCPRAQRLDSIADDGMTFYPEDLVRAARATPFAQGDLVILKSGGPVMTVYRVTNNGPRSEGRVEVEWFADRELKRDVLAPAELLRIGS